jgi:hypothetical protein
LTDLLVELAKVVGTLVLCGEECGVVGDLGGRVLGLSLSLLGSGWLLHLDGEVMHMINTMNDEGVYKRETTDWSCELKGC